MEGSWKNAGRSDHWIIDRLSKFLSWRLLSQIIDACHL